MFKNDFSPTSVLYYNTGTFSLIPQKVLKAQVEYLKEFESNPTMNLFDAWPRMWAVQKTVAPLLGANAEDIFLRHNVTGSLNDFLLGVKLPPGDIAVTNLEYGAMINICKLRCRNEGRKLVVVDIPPENKITSAPELIDCIDKQLGPNVRMLMISHVCTGTGLNIPLQELADVLAKKKIVLAVDGAQGAGNRPLVLNNFKNLHFYGGNFHKWFMGPKGTGFGWVPKWFQQELIPIQGSWTIDDTPLPFQPFGDENRFALMMLSSSCLSFPSFYALTDLANWWSEKGADNIYKRVAHLRDALEERAKCEGWTVLSNSLPELKSPLLAVELPDKYSGEALKWMYHLANEKKVQLAVSPWRGKFTLRLSAHVYNDESEFDELFSKISFLLK